MQNGGKAYKNSFSQFLVKASTYKESGSLCQETYLTHLEFNLVAKRSIDGWPKVRHILAKTLSDNSYSVCVAIFSLINS